MFSQSVVIICIGSEKLSGDCFAPYVGDILIGEYGLKCFVYGTTTTSVNGRNYEEWRDFVQKTHPHSLLLAVDAALGSPVGAISVRRGGIRPRAATGADKTAVGDVGLLAAVAEQDGSPLSSLMSVSALKVFEIARKVAFVIFCALTNRSLVPTCKS